MINDFEAKERGVKLTDDQTSHLALQWDSGLAGNNVQTN